MTQFKEGISKISTRNVMERLFRNSFLTALSLTLQEPPGEANRNPVGIAGVAKGAFLEKGISFRGLNFPIIFETTNGHFFLGLKRIHDLGDLKREGERASPERTEERIVAKIHFRPKRDAQPVGRMALSRNLPEPTWLRPRRNHSSDSRREPVSAWIAPRE